MPFNAERRQSFERAQRIASHVASHPRLREAFEEIEDNPAALDQARANTKRFLERKGIQLPAEAEATLEPGAAATGSASGVSASGSVPSGGTANRCQ